MSNQLYVFAFTLWIPVEQASEEEEEAFKAVAAKLEKRLRDDKCEDFVFQLERGEEKQRLHYQGFMKVSDKKRVDQMGRLYQDEFPGMHFAAASTAGKAALKKYCMKEATRVAGPWMKNAPVAPLEMEVDVDLDMKTEYADIEAAPYPWQRKLTEWCDAKREERRRIIWIGDRKGNSGKSHWANWMEDTKGAAQHQYAKASDILALIVQLQEKKRLYIFTLPRAKPVDASLKDLFSAMESIKDGRIKAYKFLGGKLKMRRPHVVVVANYFPFRRETYNLASKDRWSFWRIDHTTMDLVEQPLRDSEAEYDKDSGDFEHVE